MVAGADAAREAITAPAFRARSAVVTEAPISGLKAAGVRAAGSPPGEARISDYRDERVEIRTRTTRPGLLVLTDSFYAVLSELQARVLAWEESAPKGQQMKPPLMATSEASNSGLSPAASGSTPV